MYANVLNPSRMVVLLVLAATAILASVVVVTAWIGDDAYISFRVVDNLVNGYGLRWNVDERVQAFSNPLWVLLLAPLYWLTGDIYNTALALSTALALGTLVYLLLRSPADLAQRAALALALVSSKAFIDYSTSGLENPLTNLLLVVFVSCYLIWERLDRRRVALLSLITALCLVNRMDTALLLFPSFVLMLWQGAWRQLGWITLGFTPLIAWIVFATVYFGFPFPNTAYVKIGHGLEAAGVWGQGIAYFLDSLARDPVTLGLISCAVVVAVIDRNARRVALAAGISLSLWYTAKVGGDFMSGRFFVSPFVVAVALFYWTPLKRAQSTLLIPLAVLGALFALYRASPVYAAPPWRSFIMDERQFYWRESGLLNQSKDHHPGVYSWSRSDENERDGTVTIAMMIGYRGYFRNLHQHIVDILGLSDPLLSRLPTYPFWRPGHFLHPIPEGYLESLHSGENRVKGEHLHDLWSKLLLVTRGDLWQRDRWAAIAELNLDPPDKQVLELPVMVFFVKESPKNYPLSISRTQRVEQVWRDARTLVIEGQALLHPDGRLKLGIFLGPGSRYPVAWNMRHVDDRSPSMTPEGSVAHFSLGLQFADERQAQSADASLCVASFSPEQGTDFARVHWLPGSQCQ